MAVTYRVPGAVLTERAHSVPLDHSKPDGEKITIFKAKRRKRYRRKIGHRQEYTQIRVESIQG